MKAFGEYSDLWKATIRNETVVKGHELAQDSPLALYFERPKDKRGGRCPTYVELREKQQACFYIRMRNVDERSVPFVEMGNDVHEARPCPICNCQLHQVPVLIGLPGPEMVKEMKRGKALLGGCIEIPGAETALVCRKCRKWKWAGRIWQPLPDTFDKKSEE